MSNYRFWPAAAQCGLDRRRETGRDPNAPVGSGRYRVTQSLIGLLSRGLSCAADAHLPAGDAHMKYYRMAIALFTIAGISARGPGTVTDYSSRAVLRGTDHEGVPQRAPASARKHAAARMQAISGSIDEPSDCRLPCATCPDPRRPKRLWPVTRMPA